MASIDPGKNACIRAFAHWPHWLAARLPSLPGRHLGSHSRHVSDLDAKRRGGFCGRGRYASIVDQVTVTPASLTIVAYLAFSARKNAAAASGVVGLITLRCFRIASENGAKKCRLLGRHYALNSTV